MPVKEVLKSGTSVCMTDTDDDVKEKEKESAKKLKEFFTQHSFNTAFINTAIPHCFSVSAAATEQHHSVETPPPDMA